MILYFCEKSFRRFTGFSAYDEPVVSEYKYVGRGRYDTA
jgi:hypothetical protein